MKETMTKKAQESTRSPNFWILVFISVRNFTDGCETYFIAPTAWYYIKSLGQTKTFLALVLTSFNLSAVISSPIVGHIADRFGHFKLLIVLSYVVKVLGNVLYTVNVSAIFPLLGRIVSGMADSSFGILMGKVALHTSEGNRARMFVFLEATFCVGTAFGPALGSFVAFDADIFGLKINAGNSPGVVLTFIWLVSLFGALCLPRDFGEQKASEVEMLIPSDSGDSEDERRVADSKPRIERNSRVLCLFYLIFWNEVFASTATFYTPLLALDVLHLSLFHVKLYFLNGALSTLLLFIAMYIASHYLKERQILLLSMATQISSIVLLISFAYTWDKVSYIHYYILLFYVSLGMPYFAFSFGGSLLSKITSPRNAAFFQGSSMATLNLAIVASRITASFIFTKTSLLCFSVGLAFFWLLGVVWFGLLYRTFVPRRSYTL